MDSTERTALAKQDELSSTERLLELIRDSELQRSQPMPAAEKPTGQPLAHPAGQFVAFARRKPRRWEWTWAART
ncbi:MAG: hypothetical protein MZV70_46120 [Desulfobacterales bacterium]|nr:hypothetical protein [Desulfobacterales bacterium]